MNLNTCTLWVFLHKSERSCFWTIMCLSNGCFYPDYWAVAPNVLLITLKTYLIISSLRPRGWLVGVGGFLRELVEVHTGGGGTQSGQGVLSSLYLTEMSVCLPVRQTYQRWSHTIPIPPQRRGGPASLTCPPTPPTKETTSGMDGWIECKTVEVSSVESCLDFLWRTWDLL